MAMLARTVTSTALPSRFATTHAYASLITQMQLHERNGVVCQRSLLRADVRVPRGFSYHSARVILTARRASSDNSNITVSKWRPCIISRLCMKAGSSSVDSAPQDPVSSQPQPPPPPPPGGNRGLAAGAALAAAAAFTAARLFSGGPSLASLERQSVPLEVALRNEKPTVIEFYANW